MRSNLALNRTNGTWPKFLIQGFVSASPMKTSISAHKLKLVEKAGAELPLLLVGFESGNLAQLGRLCECVCQLDEYLTGTPE